MIDDKRLQEIRERCDKATKGPWGWRFPLGGLPQLFSRTSGLPLVMDAVRHKFNEAQLRFATRTATDRGGLMSKADAYFDPPGNSVPDFQESKNPDMCLIAHARTDIPDLLAEIERLKALVPKATPACVADVDCNPKQ